MSNIQEAIDKAWEERRCFDKPMYPDLSFVDGFLAGMAYESGVRMSRKPVYNLETLKEACL